MYQNIKIIKLIKSEKDADSSTVMTDKKQTHKI